MPAPGGMILLRACLSQRAGCFAPSEPHTMRPPHSFACLCVAALIAALSCRAVAATPQEVDQAIHNAIAYIYSQQDEGNWELVRARLEDEGPPSVSGWQWGGVTSIATCGLLYARESPQDPRIRQALDWLKQAEIRGLYALGFRCQVWAMAPRHPGVLQAARAD